MVLYLCNVQIKNYRYPDYEVSTVDITSVGVFRKV